MALSLHHYFAAPRLAPRVRDRRGTSAGFSSAGAVAGPPPHRPGLFFRWPRIDGAPSWLRGQRLSSSPLDLVVGNHASSGDVPSMRDGLAALARVTAAVRGAQLDAARRCPPGDLRPH